MILPDNLHQFLSALGSSVLNSFWQMGLLWLIVIAITKYRKNISPETLGNISFTALVAGFVAFIATFIISYQSPDAAGVLVWTANSYLPGVIINTSAGIYLLLLLLPVTRLLIGYKNVRLLKTTGLQRAPGKYKIFMLDMISYLGIKRKVSLWLSEKADTPLTIGFFKPVILLPIALINHLTPAQVETIILHELAHIKKNDYLVNFIGQVIITFLYFNPFAKALLQIHSAEREKTADSRVLQFEYNDHQYASTLLQLARYNLVQQPELGIKASGNDSQLYGRVQWIMGLRQRPMPGIKKTVAATCFTMLLFLLLPGMQKSSSRTIITNDAPTVSTVTTTHLPLFAAANENNEDVYSIKPIPSIIDAEKPAENKIIYLKQVEDPETGIIKIITPEEINTATTPYVFTAETGLAVPMLTEQQEQNVQQAIAAAKKVFAETNWQQVENSLAESVTSEQKALLKEAFKALIKASDWNRHADALRIAYNQIEWPEIKTNLNMAIAYIKLDSIYNQYHTALEQYYAIKKDIEENRLQEIDKKIADTEKILKQADSLRKKRIIEL